jgi:uncharacterized protein (DUF58 family)
MKNNDKVGAILFSDEIELFVPPRKGRSHALRIVRELISFEPRRQATSLKKALEYLNHVLKRRSIVFVISDFIDAGYETALRIAGKRHDLIGIALLDPRENELPKVGLITFRDAETGLQRWIDTSDASVRDSYQEYRRSIVDERRAVFIKGKLDAVEVRLDQPYMKPLVDFFRLRERRW